MIGHFEMAAEVVARGLGTAPAHERPPVERALSAMVPGYAADDVRSMIRDRLRGEIEARWPGLTLECDLRDDTTFGALAGQLSVRLAEWFGD